MRVPANQWYPVLESHEVQRKPVAAERLGRKFVFWRSGAGQLHAQQDRCPHLGAALSAGRIEEGGLVCPFHGFRFGPDGRCQFIPALGRDGKIPEGFAVPTYRVREDHGLIWLWWGDPARAEPAVPFFSLLETGWRYRTITADWPVHYTRAIENQLDVAHLPFVHRSTIGAGGRTRVDGPYVEADRLRIRVWASNRHDEGATAPTYDELATIAATRDPSFEFRFPGVWMLNISSTFKNFIAFVPVNEGTTRYYLRTYFRGRSSLLKQPYDRMMALASRIILNQDRTVVVTQTPRDSSQAREDRLFNMDRAIIQFRRLHAQLQAPELSAEDPN